ncbi:MAG: threonylcarbamoyl-AMP synthase [Candidatus Harrisonbacteria bacterium CG10_big_fil_rev_8_21_14_0_10_42_17]|uniref:L-threonylcarbamoyladenylate synthase n=1 Tax=Candidatus Harrisonbacteria bacterium CG10_big_fil_rev_8_21_14_0_10_42_17 TaxID=1974584 RepID=A0A2M6WIC4_9BACT|nr:MAG: threonylcarbamoyl-AMP synthase [Candidatus Harrisonbacteria bacterium CG10_big_fil_rev_8_21_14_0_10_42_17]
MSVNISEIVQTLKADNNNIVCMPSDTVYGLFACAFNRQAVERLYEVKGRDENKPFIILLASKEELEKFGVTNLSEVAQKILQTYTPGSVTFIVEVQSPEFEYLKRNGKTLAFRIPDDETLQSILKETGPLVAPSANPQGLATARNIEEAKAYFRETVNLYVDGGDVKGEPSTIVDVSEEKLKIVRQGKIHINL